MGKSIVTDCARINGSVVLSTCNRFEVYLDVDLNDGARPLQTPAPHHVEHAVQAVADLISRAASVDRDRARTAFTVRTGAQVVDHLFAVASGLDSLVIGEREIAGQVRKSLQDAHSDALTTGPLERLFQRALRTSKRIATHTQLSADGRSVVSVALDLAAPALPAWTATSALVVGTGAYAGATVAALRARGVRDISVYSGSGRAHTFAHSHRVVPVEDLTQAVADADIVLCCSGTGGRTGVLSGVEVGEAVALGVIGAVGDGTVGVAESEDFLAQHVQMGGDLGTRPADHPEALLSNAPALAEPTVKYVLDRAAVVNARKAREAQFDGPQGSVNQQVVVDLALHKDADPRISEVESVLLIDLKTIRANVPKLAENTVGHAREVLESDVTEFVGLEKIRAADAVIARLVESFAHAKETQVSELVAQGVAPEIAEARVAREVNPHMHQLIVQVRQRMAEGVTPDQALASLGLVAAAGLA